MRRFAAIGLSIGLAALSAAAVAGAAPRVAARLLTCHRGAEDAARYAVFEGRMRSRGREQHMEMRFELLERLPGGSFDPVEAPGLGTWAAADPGIVSYRYTRRVVNLAAPAEYQAIVSFRWVGADGVELASAERRTPICAQLDYRANLTVVGLDGVRASAGQAQYKVTVLNAGRSAAGAFGVGLSLDGVSLAPQPLAGLAPGARMALSFAGPACAPGSTLVAVADPDNHVAEASEDDNVLTASCPLPAR